VSDQVDQYLAFCLFALGRTAEAESVAEALIRRDPLLHLDENAAAPRIEEMFTSVRRRLLPDLIRAEYRDARTSAEQKDLSTAESRFKRVRRLLDEATRLGVSDATLEDLALTVDGFLALTRAAADAAPGSAPAAAPEAASSRPAPVPSSDSTSREPARIYDISDQEVTAPVAVFQKAPPTSWPTPVATALSGVKGSAIVAIVVDEKGDVADAAIVEPIHPLYDRLLLSAVRHWKYKPALRAGVPVRYRESVRVELK
jgi:TonB family protein